MICTVRLSLSHWLAKFGNILALFLIILVTFHFPGSSCLLLYFHVLTSTLVCTYAIVHLFVLVFQYLFCTSIIVHQFVLVYQYISLYVLHQIYIYIKFIDYVVTNIYSYRLCVLHQINIYIQFIDYVCYTKYIYIVYRLCVLHQIYIQLQTMCVTVKEKLFVDLL